MGCHKVCGLDQGFLAGSGGRGCVSSFCLLVDLLGATVGNGCWAKWPPGCCLGFLLHSSFTGATCTGEEVNPPQSEGALGDLLVPDERWGPLPNNKTLFLGYAFLLTTANSAEKLLRGPNFSPGGEEEEGERPAMWGRT